MERNIMMSNRINIELEQTVHVRIIMAIPAEIDIFDFQIQISLEKGGVLETCCCRGDLCIPVPANVTVIHVKDNNDTYSNNTDVTVTRHHLIITNSAHTDWLFVGGLIAAGVLVLVVIGTVVTVWQVKKRREAEARSRMMFSYTPISSSEVENGDLHMLL